MLHFDFYFLRVQMVEGYSSTCNRIHFSSRLLGKVVWLSRTRVCRMRCLISVCLWIQVCCVKRTMGDCFGGSRTE